MQRLTGKKRNIDMGKIAQVLAELGQDMGLSALAPSADGHMQLRLESGVLLGLSTHGEEAVLHYATPVRYDAAQLAFKAMRKVAQADSAADPVQVGLRTTQQGEWLVAATRLPLDRLSAREVHRLGAYLQSWLEQARA